MQFFTFHLFTMTCTTVLWLCKDSKISINRQIKSSKSGKISIITLSSIPFHRNGYAFSPQWLCLFSVMAMPFQYNGYAFSPQWLCLFCAMAMPFLNEGIVILTRRDSYCEPSVVIQYKLHCYFLGGGIRLQCTFLFSQWAGVLALSLGRCLSQWHYKHNNSTFFIVKTHTILFCLVLHFYKKEEKKWMPILSLCIIAGWWAHRYSIQAS